MAIEWTAVPHSSNLDRIGYDPETSELQVQFRSGATYAYSGVSRQTAAGLASASSPGSFFASTIKDRYPTRKL